jgi:hypothetical protein
MKTVVVILTLMAAAALVAAASGVERIFFTGHGVIMTQHNALGRSAAAIFSIFCGVAAYGCAQRKMYAWRMVAAMLVLLAVYGAAWTIWKICTTELDLPGNVLGALGEGAKITAVVWFLVARWLPLKKEFNRTALVPDGGQQPRITSGRHSVVKQIVWWLTWTVLATHLVALPLIFGIPLSNRGASEFGWRLILVVAPLAVASGARWLVLPHIKSVIPSFFLFLVGLVFTEMSGLMVLFLQPPYRAVLYGLCVAGMLQFLPIFIPNALPKMSDH